MNLVPNAPAKRLEFVFKTYWKKYPLVVSDVVNTASFLMGVDKVAPPFLGDHRYHEEVREMKGRIAVLEEPFQFLPQVDPSRTAFLASMKRAGLFEYDMDEVAHKVVAADESSADELLPTLDDFNLMRLAQFMFRHFPVHHEGDFLIPWVARELVALWKVTVSGSDTDRIAAKRAYGEVTDLLENKAPAIAQWAKETKTDIGKLNLAQALEAIAKYRFKTKAGPQGVIAYTFDDGWTVQDLRTQKELEAEGKNLAHCVGGYTKEVADGNSRIYSLRDPAGRPYVTMEWQPDTDAIQEMGGGGRRAWDEYVKMTAEEFNDPTPTSQAAKFRRRGNFQQIFGSQNCELSGDECAEWLRSIAEDEDSIVSTQRLRNHVETFIRERFNGDAYGLFMAGVPASKINWNGVAIHESSGGDNLSGADLRRAHVVPGTSFGRLKGANLSGLDLHDGDFSPGTNTAIVAEADFTGCNLRGADFRGCDCTGADFTRCDLSGANFGKADLDHADFTGATISTDTSFYRARHVDIPDGLMLKWGDIDDIPLDDVFDTDRDGYVLGRFVKDRYGDGLWKTRDDFEAEQAGSQDDDEPDDEDDDNEDE